ncbi:MAG: NifU family protein [Phycisphaerales bacterium]
MAKTSDISELHEQVASVIAMMRPAIQADGGDVELVQVDERNVVHVRFHGACVGCPSASMTLHSGIARRIMERIPQITGVELIE